LLLYDAATDTAQPADTLRAGKTRLEPGRAFNQGIGAVDEYPAVAPRP
jgi:hypothetical protein